MDWMPDTTQYQSLQFKIESQSGKALRWIVVSRHSKMIMKLHVHALHIAYELLRLHMKSMEA